MEKAKCAVPKSLPLWGRWRGEAVTDEVLADSIRASVSTKAQGVM